VAVPLSSLRGVPDVPFAATSEDQAEDTAWSSFYDIAGRCEAADRLDINIRKIIDQLSGGNARVVTSSSIARDGGRPTSTIIEEPHLWYSAELKNLFRTMDRNLAKLGQSDPHAFKVSTMFKPGQGSVLEDDYDATREGDPSILFDHRGASAGLNPLDDADVLRGVREARGDAVWLDADRIARNFRRDPSEGIRYWWNRRSLDVTRCVDPEHWAAIAESRVLEDNEPIVCGFDGSLFDDNTALSARSLIDGYSFPLGVWNPSQLAGGTDELQELVSATLAEATERYRLVLMLCDPPYWSEQIARWRTAYGDKVVLPYWTNRDNAMSWAAHRWHTGITTKAWRHNGDPTVASHVANAHKRTVRTLIDGSPAWVPRKERHHGAAKIDACVTDILSHEARFLAIAQGALDKLNKHKDRTLYTF
jgi:hypothetical protein